MVEVLADGLWAYRLGQAAFALIFVLVGALLLGIGIYRRRVFNRWSTGDDDRLPQLQPSLDGEGDVDDDEFDPRLRDDYDPAYDSDDEDLEPRPSQPPVECLAGSSQPPGKGTAFIAVGAVVLILGALNVLSTLTAPRATAEGRGVEVGPCITAQAYDQGL